VSVVRFDQSTYDVHESDGKVNITLHLSNISSFNIKLIVNGDIGTASGEWSSSYVHS